MIGILDWELSTLGHPLADLGYCAMPWHTAPDEYGGILGLDGAALGIPTEAEFLRHYYAHAVPTAPLLRFHLVFALFRFAVTSSASPIVCGPDRQQGRMLPHWRRWHSASRGAPLVHEGQGVILGEASVDPGILGQSGQV